VEQRAVHAIAERRVWCRPNQDSATATIGAVLPADGAQLLMTALDVAAEHSARHCGSDDARTLDQRRADALVQLAIDALTGYRSCTQGPDGHDSVVADDNTEPDVAGADQRGDAPRWHGARPRIQVSVALSTLLGLDDQPGELSGHGPIPATLARAVAGDPTGTWYRLITDAQGHLVDYGRTRYRPPAPLRDHVIARDCECQFPGCHRPAVRAEQDHVIAWADGGTTCADNLLALCLRHHHLKHDTTWTVQRIADGRLRWTSPTGRAYHREPATYPVDITASVVVVPDDNNETATPPAAA
jgi:hypothetical protein